MLTAISDLSQVQDARQSLFNRVASLRERFAHVRQATMQFIEPLTPEDLMVQSCPEASPAKWHLAHTSWFFETFVLADFLPGYQPFHPDFRWLFNSYYNALGEMPEKKLRASFSRPPLDTILAYRRAVDAAIHQLLSDSMPAEQEAEVLRRVSLGLEHEQQHLELLATDIKHALYTNPLHPAYLDLANLDPANLDKSLNAAAPPQAAHREFIRFTGGLVEIGVSPEADDPLAFAFDNETPRHAVYLQPFEFANRLVTCAEYLAFMEDDGYTRPELWLSEGWTTIRSAGWQAPLYWTRNCERNGWQIYTLHGFQPLNALLGTPVCHLSFFEADAFARWAGCRLPTEFEWEHAAASSISFVKGKGESTRRLSVPSPALPRSRGALPVTANMLEMGALHPVPANETNHLQQLYGDVWEWTSSGYTGYPGYTPLPGALGEYNGKFMSSQVILRGGSAVTPATHIRATYRNFFPPATRWQFSGLRLARNL